MRTLKGTSFAFGLMLAGVAHATEPVYDCTASETKLYIEQVTHNVFAPSPVTSPEEFKKAYIEAAAAAAAAGGADSETCVTIFTDGRLEEGWKDLIDQIRNINFDLSFSGFDAAVLAKILQEAREKVTEEVTKALIALGEDICAMMSTDNLKDALLDGVNKKYGMNARNLRMKDFADGITDDALRRADKNVLMLLSEDELMDEIGDQTRGEMRTIRKDIWENF